MSEATKHPAERANTHELIRGRVTLGEFEITVLTDGYFLLDGGVMFGVVPRPMWMKRVTPDVDNHILMGSNTLVVRDGKRTVVIDTGLGNKLDNLRSAADAALILCGGGHQHERSRCGDQLSPAF
jgi:hypothetical protein